MAKIGFTSLGCDKNLVDTEKMLYILHNAGHEITPYESEADLHIINTCAFIHDAKTESIETIIELGEYNVPIIITGCLGERYREEVMKEMPEVHAIIGVHSYEKILEVTYRVLNGEKDIIEIGEKYVDTIKKRFITTTGHYEYIKIAEGCNNFCTYCIIPKIRGSYSSRKMEDIIEEAEFLARNGVKELMIVAQDITFYGMDIYKKLMLPELIREIARIDGIEWIRLLYCYPENITDELIKVIKEEDKVCKYIDMPLQHTNDRILKLMGRNTNKEEISQKINLLRQNVKDIVIRSTIIVGFPGETEDEFNELCEDIKRLEIDKLGVFEYSKEEDTPAEKMKGHIKDSIKKIRKETLMNVQERVVDRKANIYVGEVLKVIVDGKLEEEGIYCGRSYTDIPNIDGIVFFNTNNEYMAGDFVKVKIEKQLGYDLYGKEV